MVAQKQDRRFTAVHPSRFSEWYHLHRVVEYTIEGLMDRFDTDSMWIRYGY